MEYKDEDGKILHGYSSHDLKALVAQQKKNNGLMMGLLLLLASLLLVIVYVLYRIESGNIIANVVARCVC